MKKYTLLTEIFFLYKKNDETSHWVYMYILLATKAPWTVAQSCNYSYGESWKLLGSSLFIIPVLLLLSAWNIHYLQFMCPLAFKKKVQLGDLSKCRRAKTA